MHKFKTINGWTKENMKTLFCMVNNNHRSTHEISESCLYRGKNNNVCAVGAFIPDELYEKDMEGMSAGDLIKKYPELKAYMPIELTALDDFQYAHDASSNEDGRIHEAVSNWIDDNVEDSNV